jgi:integrase
MWTPDGPRKFVFSDSKLAKVPAPAKGRLELHDTKCAGLVLRITPANVRSFSVRGKIKIKGGAAIGGRVRATLGPFPDLHVEDARRLARELLNQWALGLDHRELERAQAARKTTLATIGEEYLETRLHKLKPGYAKSIREVIGGPLADLGKRCVVEITGELVLRWHQAQASLSSADRAARILRALLNYAADRHGLRLPDGRLGTDILKATSRWRRPKRRTTMIDDMLKWRQAVEALPDDGVRDLLLTLALTGCRRNELRLARWSQVDLQRGTLHLPDPKNRKPVTLPLPRQVVEMLERRQRLHCCHPDDYVFTKNSPLGLKPVGEYGLFQVTVDTAGAVGQDWCLHDLRRGYVTVADQLVPPAIARRLVHHASKSGDVHDGYAIFDAERLRPHAQQVADHIFKSPAEVIEFRARRSSGPGTQV